jgi:hypothetical protein
VYNHITEGGPHHKAAARVPPRAAGTHPNGLQSLAKRSTSTEEEAPARSWSEPAQEVLHGAQTAHSLTEDGAEMHEPSARAQQIC